MSQELSWTSFDPETGAPDGTLSLPGGDGPLPVVALLAGDREEADGWSPRAALALVRGWAREGGRIVLADLGFEAPSLHALLGEDNGEGIADAVIYGASVQRVAGRPSGERFILIPSGTPVVDPEPVLVHPRWRTLIAGFQEAGAVLALYLPLSLPGARELAERCSFRVQLGGEDTWDGPVELRLRPSLPLATVTGEAPEPAVVAPPFHARMAPAPVPREVPRPRLFDGSGAGPGPEATDEPGAGAGAEADALRLPPDMEASSPVATPDAEPMEGGKEAPSDAPREPIAWEEADPWDLPEFQPLGGSPASDDPSGLSSGEEGRGGWDVVDAVDPRDDRRDDLEGWGPEDPGAAPAESGAEGMLEEEPDTGSREEALHLIPEEEFTLVPDPGSGALESEPRSELEDPEEDLGGRDGGDAGTDPFGFLGEWGEDREEKPVPGDPGEGGDTGSEGGWGDPPEPWHGGGSSWDDSREEAGGDEDVTPSHAPHVPGPDPELLPVEVAAPLPPEAPSAWGPPAPEGVGEPAPPPVAPGPARRPPPPPRQERATGAWLLFLVLLAVAVLLGAARLGFIQIPGVTPQQGNSPLQPGLGATSTAEAASIQEAPPVPVDDLLLVVEPTSPVHALALALTAFGSAAGARAAAERLRPALPDHPVMVAPVESGGQLFHRLIVGGAGNWEEVERLREEVAPLYEGSPPSDWIVREADRAFLLAETASRAEAERQVPDLLERGIPAYVLEVPLTDGARLWRVYAGAYGSDQEASALAGLLREAGEEAATLVPLTGRPPG